MATFKVGQRVKKVASAINPTRRPLVRVPNGAEATVTQIWCDGDICVRYDLYRNKGRDGIFCEQPHMLAPLTDPHADAFIERIKKLKPYDEPVVKREPVTR